jgi:HSP20 family protein
MLSRWDLGWNDVDEMFSALNDLRTTMDRVFEDPVGNRAWTSRALSTFGGTWPRANLIDAGATLVLDAEVPGLSEKDIKLSLNQDVLTLAGERKAEAPEGYLVHRQERPALQFSRSFALPCAVNPDRASATVKDGILTVTLEKAQEAMPRQISVKAS